MKAVVKCFSVFSNVWSLKSLIWEQGSDGNMFPHLYSKLDVSDVVDEIDITLKNDGTHELPDNY